MRFLTSFTVLVCLILTTIGRAEAVTYGPITMSVPVSVSAPSVPGTYRIGVTCSSPKTATFSGIAQTTTVNISVASGRVTYGPAPVLNPVFGGLQSGATVTCTLAVTPPSPVTTQQYLSSLTYDASKMTTKIVLP